MICFLLPIYCLYHVIIAIFKSQTVNYLKLLISETLLSIYGAFPVKGVVKKLVYFIPFTTSFYKGKKYK